MSRHGVDVVAVEVTSHALALSRVEGATFRTAAFLNLGRDHLDFHGTMDAYFESKLILFESLGENATAVVAADDPRGHLIRSRTRARLITFGRAANSEVRLSEEDVRADGSRARLVLPDGAVDVRTELRGRFNLLNVAAAAGCALSLGMDRDAVRDGVAALRRIPGRLEPVKCGQPFEIFGDFAHTEQALASVLQATREFTAGRIAVVFGCGGDRDPGKRPGMGRAAAEHADYAILTSDNPRQEDPLGILREVERGFVATAGARDRYVLEPDRRAAIARVVHWARPGDTVVVAGKGHEVAQTLAEGRIPFDDRSEVREALFSAGWRN